MFRKEIPLTITFVSGVILVFAWLLKVPVLKQASAELVRWNVVVSAFAAGLGGANLLRIHYKRVNTRKETWVYSLILLVALDCIVTLGISTGLNGKTYRYVWTNLLTPLSATTFSLNAFWISSAAYRAFRIKTGEAAALAVAAVLVMLGRVGIGEIIYAKMPAIADWIIAVPNTAGMRGVTIGGALGAVSVCFRVVLGLERSHFGGLGE